MATIVRTSTLDDPRLDAYARLTDHELRGRVEGESGLLVAESPLVVEVALDEGLEPVSFLLDERHATTCTALLDLLFFYLY